MKVAVFGAGTMGLGIVETFAAHGHDTLMYASSVASAQRHLAALEKKLSQRVSRGKLTAEQRQAILDHVYVEEKSAAADADLIIETAKEDMVLKKELLGELDAMCKPETVFGTNTSALSITEMSNGLKHSLIGTHFFFPVRSMRLMEVVCGANTPQSAFDFVKKVAGSIEKEVVKVAESPGFVINRLIVPYQNEAINLVEAGVASVEDIDKAMTLALNHPIGPLTLADASGLDVILAIMETLYHETGDPKFRPALLLRKMVRSGNLGKKTGKGFYEYGPDGKAIKALY